MAASTKTVKVEITGDPSGFQRSMSVVTESSSKAAAHSEDVMTKASSKIGGAFGKLDGLLAGFGVPFTNVLSGIGDKLNDFEQKSTSTFQKVAEAGKLASAVAVVGIAAVAIESVHLADQYEKAHAQLENSLKNTGSSFEAVKKQVEAADKAGEKFGYNMTETEAALAKAQIATNDFAKSQKLLALAQDVSAKTGKDLSASMLLVIKASEGQLGALKRQGIDLNIVAGGAKATATAQAALAKAQEAGTVAEEKYNVAVKEHGKNSKQASDAMAVMVQKWNDGVAAQTKLNKVQDSGNQILAALSQRFGGSASASAETFAGKVKSLQASLEDVGIKIGTWLIPKLSDLASAIADGITWLEKHKTIAEAVGIVLGVTLVTAIAAFTVAAVASAITVIAAWAPVLVPLALITAAIVLIATQWEQLGSGIHNIYWDQIAPVLNDFIGALNTIIDAWNSVFGWLGLGISKIGEIQQAANGLKGSALDPAPGVNPFDPRGSPYSPPIPDYGKFPHDGLTYSQGGLVPGFGNLDTVPAMLTPGEFVLSKDMIRRGGAGGSTVNVYVSGSVVTERDLIATIREASRRDTRKGVPWN